MTIHERADALATLTSDAYSYDRYGHAGWRACIKMLIRRGFSDREIEAVMRSKWTRWAGDGSTHRYGRCNSVDLARFIDTDKNLKQSVTQLVRETF